MSEAGPAPISATRLPLDSVGGLGSRCEISPFRSAATRFRRQIATGAAIQAAAAAGRLAGPVAGAAQNAGKHIGFPVDHVGIGVLALCDQTDVLAAHWYAQDRPIGNRLLCGSNQGAEHRWSSRGESSSLFYSIVTPLKRTAPVRALGTGSFGCHCTSRAASGGRESPSESRFLIVAVRCGPSNRARQQADKRSIQSLSRSAVHADRLCAVEYKPVTDPFASFENSNRSPLVRDTKSVSEFGTIGSFRGFAPSCRNSTSLSSVITAWRPARNSYVPVYLARTSGASSESRSADHVRNGVVVFADALQQVGIRHQGLGDLSTRTVW